MNPLHPGYNFLHHPLTHPDPVLHHSPHGHPAPPPPTLPSSAFTSSPSHPLLTTQSSINTLLEPFAWIYIFYLVYSFFMVYVDPRRYRGVRVPKPSWGLIGMGLFVIMAGGGGAGAAVGRWWWGVYKTWKGSNNNNNNDGNNGYDSSHRVDLQHLQMHGGFSAGGALSYLSFPVLLAAALDISKIFLLAEAALFLSVHTRVGRRAIALLERREGWEEIKRRERARREGRRLGGGGGGGVVEGEKKKKQQADNGDGKETMLEEKIAAVETVKVRVREGLVVGKRDMSSSSSGFQIS